MSTKFPLRSLSIGLCLFLLNCSTGDDGNPNTTAQMIADISANMSVSSWRISSYIDSGEDETSDFEFYNFTFASDGTLTASNGTNTLVGSWSVTSSSSSDDDNDDDIDFNINFPVPDTNPFEDLNDDWDVISYTSTSIVLRDVSGGDGSVDSLSFVQN